MPTREEQKEQRRRLIITKATELFVKNGFSETKIGDIAKAADMSVGLLFHYFESKEHLYEELVKIGVQYSASPEKISFKKPPDYFKTCIDGIYKAARQEPFVLYMFVLMGQASRSESIPPHIRELAMSVDQMRKSADIIRSGQRQGYFRKGDPYLLSFTFWSALQGILEQIATTPEQFGADAPYPDAAWILDLIIDHTDKERKNDHD